MYRYLSNGGYPQTVELLTSRVLNLLVLKSGHVRLVQHRSATLFKV